MDKASRGILKFHEVMDDSQTSGIRRYRQITVGDEGYGHLIVYELLQLLLSGLPGALGIAARQLGYRYLFHSLGSKVVIGRNVCFRQPRKVSVGNGSVIDDFSRITVAGSRDASIRIGNKVLLGPYTVCSSRNATIEIHDYTTIGSHCRLGAMEGRLRIGQYVMIGAFSYIGGGNHSIENLDQPMATQEFKGKGGVTIEDDVWIGGHVMILDGVTIGRGSVVGAYSLVTKDIPPYSIAFGAPARVRGSRKAAEPQPAATGAPIP